MTGPTKMPTRPKPSRPPMTPAKIRSNGKVGAALDENRTQEVVHGADDQRPHPQEDAPAGRPVPEDPDRGRCKHQRRSDLHDAKHEHHRREQGGEWHARNGEPDAANHRLHDGRNAHAQRHAADALPARTTAPSPRGPPSRRPKRRASAAADSPWAYITPAMTTVSRTAASARPRRRPAKRASP